MALDLSKETLEVRAYYTAMRANARVFSTECFSTQKFRKGISGLLIESAQKGKSVANVRQLVVAYNSSLETNP